MMKNDRPIQVVHVQKITGIGGSEHHLLDLLQGLGRRGIEPRLIILQDASQPASAFLTKVERVRIPYTVLPIRWHIDPILAVRLARLLTVWRPTVVHTHLIHADLHAIPAARYARVPVVISTKHNDDPFRLRTLGQIDRAISMLADRIIVISEHLRQFYESVERIPSSRIVRIYYGLPADSVPRRNETFRPTTGIDSEAPLAGVVARLVEQKGHRYLLEAFSDVRRTVPGAKLLIVGDGPLREELERYTSALGLGGSVIFTGFRDDIASVMAAIDVFVLPSLWEGFGLVLLEAMRAGKPIVASRVSAIPEIVVDDETGLLVPPADSVSLARALTDLLSNREACHIMGAAGRRRLEQAFSCDRMIDSIAEVYSFHGHRSSERNRVNV